jgi:hypothetical protein
VSLVLDADDQPHVFYLSDDDDLRHVYRAAGAWTDELLFAGSIADPAVTRGPDGVMHACFSKEGEIRYAVNESGQWEQETIAAQGSMCRVAVGAAGTVYLLFFHLDPDTYDRTIRLVWSDGNRWRHRRIVEYDYLYDPQVPALALGSDESVHLLYRISAVDGEFPGVMTLFYVSNAGGEWRRAVIDYPDFMTSW